MFQQDDDLKHLSYQQVKMDRWPQNQDFNIAIPLKRTCGRAEEESPQERTEDH